MAPLLPLLSGLVLLVLGSEVVVRQGSAIAARLGVSPMLIGMTVIALATSLPELAVGIRSAQQGAAELGVGNIVGTNLVNLLLILGISALISAIVLEPRTLRIDLPIIVATGVLLVVLAADGTLTTVDGVVLTLCGLGYLVATILAGTSRAGAEALAAPPGDSPAAPAAQSSPAGAAASLPRRIVVLVIGLAVVLLGAELLVDGASGLARSAGLDEAVIGLTIVAVGTSAPELVTTVVSSLRGARDLALGNLLGSSVFNILLVLGPTVILAPGAVVVPEELIAGDLLIMAVAAAALVPLFRTHRRLGRLEGALLVLAYLLYLGWLLATRI
ncbi:calcium/sodium antiporter [Brachybacterium hainanense]|uniref:Calcium/sodium antiporter n=1 Tax=Brachybacterium hainanense TaxID=1541174 RepID=A0ABV6RBA3_9MICO